MGYPQPLIRKDILKDRDKEYPLTPKLEQNLQELLFRLNHFQVVYGKQLTVSSGYRPGHYNSDVGGAPDSPHLTCEACDLHDRDNLIKVYISDNPSVLTICDLYQESPDRTATWAHLDTRKRLNRVFKP